MVTVRWTATNPSSTRTDVGGAYRWDTAERRWVQMLLTGTLEDDELVAGDYSVASIAVSPTDPDTVVLVAGADFNPGDGQELSRTGRVLRSTDGGETWTTSDQRWFESGNQAFRTGSERIAIDPTDPERILLGTQREGLWTSADGGETWDRVPSDEVPDGVTDDPAGDQAGVSLVTFLPGDDAPPTALVGVAHEGLFTSEGADGGWEPGLGLESGERPSSATPAGDDLLLSIDTPGRPEARLLRIVDGDADDPVEVDAPGDADRWNLAADPFDPDRLVATDDAVRDDHLWTSTDGGGSWASHSIEIDAERVPWLAQTDLTS